MKHEESRHVGSLHGTAWHLLHRTWSKGFWLGSSRSPTYTSRRHDVTTSRRHVPLDDGYVGVV